MKEKPFKIITIVLTYVVMYGLMSLFTAIFHSEYVSIAFVTICLIIVWNTAKKIVGTGSILRYIAIFFVAAIIGQFVAPFELGLKIANKILWYYTSIKIADMEMDEILAIEKELKPYIQDIQKEIAKAGKADDEFMRKKIYCAYGCEIYADASALYNLAVKRNMELQKK